MTAAASSTAVRPAAWPLAQGGAVLRVQRAPDAGDGVAAAIERDLETLATGAGLTLGAAGASAAVRLAGPAEPGGAPRRLAASTLRAGLDELADDPRTRDALATGLLVLDPDPGIVTTTLEALCGARPGPAAVALVRGADDPPGGWDRPLFDAGYVRLKPGAAAVIAEPADAYLRSDLLTDLGLLREPSSANAISMQTLGQNGRFANQLWQYGFLWLYGLRNNCRIQTPRWVGNLLYGVPAEPPDPSFTRQAFTVFTGVERHLWSMAEPPVNVDFFGYFQEIPESWRRHRQLLRRLFTPQPGFVDLIERWFKRSVPSGATLVGIHVRRGDYSYFDHTAVPWFRPIPIEWYDTFLEELWPTLERPALFVATDDAATVGPHFARYEPILAPSSEIAIPEFAFMPDFMGMQRSHVLAMVNSSFSRMAGLLADDGQVAYLPNMKTQRFERYAPWHEEDFWSRFEA